jgi:hypothetical protein
MTFKLALAAAALAVFAGPAVAKDARCFTTDDGYFDCSFEAMGGGDFEITADGHPSFQIVIDRPGFAFGYAQYEPDGRFVALPGMFVRDRDDGACWHNPETETKICAW